MTELYCHTDSYLHDSSATGQAVEGQEVALDPTASYARVGGAHCTTAKDRGQRL